MASGTAIGTTSVFALSRLVGLVDNGEITSVSGFVFSRFGVLLSAGSAAAQGLDVAVDLVVAAAAGAVFASELDAAAALDFLFSGSVFGGSTTTAPAAAAAFFSLVSWSNFSMICSRV